MKITDEVDIIEFYLTSIIKKFGLTNDNWTDDNTIKITKGTGKKLKELGTVKLDNDKMDISGEEIEEFVKTMVAKKEERDKKKITPELVNASPFKKLISNPNYFNGLNENFDMFEEANDLMKSIGVDNFVTGEYIDMNKSATKKLTIYADCSLDNGLRERFDEGYDGRLKEFLFNTFKHSASSKTAMMIYNSNDRGFFFHTEDEKVDKIELSGMILGKYYRERNVILLTFNPFLVKKITKLTDELPDILYKLVELIEELKPETVDTKEFAKKQFMISFIKGSIDTLRINKDKLIKYAKYEVELEGKIRETVSQRIETEKEIEHIEKNIRLGGKGISDELTLTEQLPFIEKVELDTASILLKFKPTCLKVNELDLENGKTFGKRTFYLGSLTFKISPQDIQIKGDIEGVRAHPHSNGTNPSWGGCCFGDSSSDGRRKLFEMLALNKFSEVAKMLWFWIKTYINGSAYAHHVNFYNEMLSGGVPIWDENGVRININEPDRIKTGEQTTISKRSVYEANIKKYAEVQIC